MANARIRGHRVISPTPVSDISISANTIPENAVQNDPVGTLSTNLSASGISVSWALSGADAAKLQLSSATGVTVELQRSDTGTLTEGVPLDVTVTATRGSSTPYQEPFEITVTGTGADVTLAVVRWTEGSGNAQTNVPITFGWPLAPGVLTSGNRIKVFQGVSELEIDQINEATPPAATDPRMCVLSVLLPSCDADEVVDLTVKVGAGTKDTGTDTTAADILATTYEALDTIDIDGVAYYASARDGLSESTATAWSMTAPKNHGKWYTGGGLATMHLVSSPYRKVSDDTPHATLRAYFYICAYKADRAAVSGPNPITRIHTVMSVESGWLTVASPANLQYGSEITKDTTPETVADYPNTYNVATGLTLSANTVGNDRNLDRASGVWASDIVGAIIRDHATGIAVVASRVSDTRVTARIAAVFTGTSIASGDWDIVGVNHCYHTRRHADFWWGGDPVPLARQPTAYLLSTKMILNYNKASASITLNMSNLDAQGTRPFSGAGRALNGDFNTALGTSGAAQNIGVDPQYCIEGVLKVDGSGYYTDDSYRKIFENGVYTGLIPWFARNESTGLIPKFNAGTNWNWNPAFSGGTDMVFPTGVTPSRQDADIAHHPMNDYIPYLLTGHPYWLDGMGMMAFYFWGQVNTGFSGTSQLTRVMLGRESGGEISTNLGQMRSQAWVARSLIDLVAVIPDTVDSGVFSQNRTDMETYWANWQSRGKTDYVDHTTPTPAAAEEFVDGGPRYTAVVQNAAGMDSGYWYFAQYQANYFCLSLLHGSELEMFDSNGQAFTDWFIDGNISGFTQTDVPVDGSVAWQWRVAQTTARTYYQTWLLTWDQTRSRSDFSNWRYLGTVTGTLTLPDGTSGTNIRVVSSIPVWTSVSSDYVNGWFRSGTGAGRGRIVSIDDSQTMRIDTTVTGFANNGATFAASSYAPGNWQGPLPVKADWTDQTLILGSGSMQSSNDYMRTANAIAIVANDNSYVDADTAAAYIATWASSTSVDLSLTPQWAVGART